MESKFTNKKGNKREKSENFIQDEGKLEPLKGETHFKVMMYCIIIRMNTYRMSGKLWDNWDKLVLFTKKLEKSFYQKNIDGILI